MSIALPHHAIAPGPERIEPSAFGPANRRRLSGPGLRTFLAVADLWGLSEEQRRLLLGLPSRSTFHSWAKAAREHRDITLDLDALLRISAVLGVHQALQILHEREADGIAWLKSPHHAPIFGGQTPLAVMTGGSQDAILSVRRYLDAMRGGIFAAPNAV
ncbi:MAG: MbcA/ParS/Xre antitoxin family protein, partial [Beijerinckiaceae bacterium]